MIGARQEWLGSARVRVGLVLVLVAVGLVPVLSRKASWLGSWKMALDWGTFSITLLGPVAAGVACTVYVRIRRSQFVDLFGQSSRPWLGWTAPAIAVWLLGSVAVLALCAFTTTATWLSGAHAYPALAWVVLPAILVLAAQVAIGALVGSLAGHYWAAPWAAIATFTLFILTSLSVIPAVFRTGGVSGALSGDTFHSPTFVLQAVAALGIASAAMAASHWDLFRVASLGSRAVTATTVIGALVALYLLGDDHDRYVAADTVAYVCRDGRPVVCMSQDTTRPLDDLAAKMQRLAAHLEAAGARLPERFVQELPGVTPDPDTGVLRLFVDEVLAEQVSYVAAAESLATPARCAAYSSDRGIPESVFTVLSTLVRWILVQDGQESAPSGDDPLADWWALPAGQQHPWVGATYDALSSCRLRELRLPASSAAPR